MNAIYTTLVYQNNMTQLGLPVLMFVYTRYVAGDRYMVVVGVL